MKIHREENFFWGCSAIMVLAIIGFFALATWALVETQRDFDGFVECMAEHDDFWFCLSGGEEDDG